MDELPYKIGTIKLTWINPKDYTILQSKMFKSVDEALQNIPTSIKKDEYMIFELTETDGVSYKWKLLPYGNYNSFIRSMEFRDNKLLYYGSMSLALIGALYVIKSIFNN